MPNDEAEAPEDYQQIVQKFVRKKPRRVKKDGTPYKTRAGWGPYRSVPNERAVAFNLQLDVQNLQQQVHNMSALRDILRTKMLLQRDAPDGSFVRVVNEFFTMFRQGVPVKEVGRKRPADDRIRDQREFLRSVMDPDVDAGSGLYGPDVMMDQMTIYSTFLHFKCYQMHSFDIVKAEDSVVITTQSTLHCQIRRATIEKVFPHIMGEEWLVAQLVGQEVEFRVAVSFYFNAAGKCCKFAVDMDFVGAFASIVKDPSIIDLLLGRALILFGLIDEPQSLDEEPKIASPTGFMKVLEDERHLLAKQISDLRSMERGEHYRAALPPAPSSTGKLLSQDVQRACLEAVEEYYVAFADGYVDPGCAKPAAVIQRDFLLHRFGSKAACANAMVERWKSLSESFSVLGFHQKCVGSVALDQQTKAHVVTSSARYSLCITPATITSVFPHVAASPRLCGALVGEVLIVPSQVHFTIDLESERKICCIEERMDFVAAMAKILADRHQLQFVLSEANLALDGVSCHKENALGSSKRRKAQCLLRSPRGHRCWAICSSNDAHL
jgi:hypothetical protein